MNPDILADILQEPILQTRSLGGGDISRVLMLETPSRKVVAKIHPDVSLFEAEKDGLEGLAAVNAIRTPDIFACQETPEGAVLLMEYVAPKRPDQRDFEGLGQNLAHLHLHPQHEFGWRRDNYIGSLPQSNTPHPNWASFYVQERLLPQLRMSRDKQLLNKAEVPSPEKLATGCQQLFSEVQPALLHGDLWSGNYLIATDGTPYLIDPAVYVGHHEVDLAMSRLFGGFGQAFYDVYHEIIPAAPGMNARNDWYQLYYLLVHLNLFGSSYRNSVMSILKKYVKS
ncbi:MAG: fructosamine kinase family protein [Bacteroidota bacterium]